MAADSTYRAEDGGASRPRRRRRITGWRKWALRLALAIGFPTLLLALLEGSLRLFGFGYSTSFFAPLPQAGALAFNEKFTWLFAPRELAPKPDPFSMPARKGDGVYRVFILGESAAMGTPDGSYGFGRILLAMLRAQYPQARFEVVNAGITAINSHVILPIARDCAAHQPDLFIIYMGNNEVVGPYGPSTIFREYSPSLGLIRAGLAVRSTRTGQLVEKLIERLQHKPPTFTEWKGMELFAGGKVAFDDPRRQIVYQHFGRNLRDILAACRSSAPR